MPWELFNLLMCSSGSRNDPEDAVLEVVPNTKNGSSCEVTVCLRGLFISVCALLQKKKTVTTQ